MHRNVVHISTMTATFGRIISRILSAMGVQAGRFDDLATERAVYAEIGRIVSSPFSIADVYERFAAQVREIIPTDRIVITYLDTEHDSLKIKYVLGTNVRGMEQGEDVSLKYSIVSEVAKSKRAVRTNRLQDNEIFMEAGLLSRIATPLIANEKVVGTLHVASTKLDAYSDQDLVRLETVGNQIAGAIASAFLLQAERDRANQLKALYSVVAILAKPQSFETKAQEIVEILVRIAEAEQAMLRRVDPQGDHLELVATAGTGAITFAPSLKVTAKTLVNQAFSQGQNVLINDYQHFGGATPGVLGQGVASVFLMPVKSGGRTLGLLNVLSKTVNHFDEGRVALLTAFADEIGVLFDAANQADQLQATRERALADERRRSRELAGLYEISRIFSEIGDFKSKTTAALDKLVILANGDWATFRMAGEAGPGLHLTAAAGPAVAEYPPLPVITEDYGISTTAFTDGRIIVTDDYTAWPAASQYLIDMGMRSFVFLPVKARESTLGLVTVISKEKRHFTQEMVDLLSSVVEELGVFVENSILQDEAVKAHWDMRQLAERLSRSNQELEQFANAASHDLQEPLRMVSSFTQLLASRYKDKLDADAQEFIGYAVDGANRMQTQIRDLLAYSRVTTQGIPFEPTECSDLFDHAVANLMVSIQESGATITRSSLPNLMVDKTQIVSVFQNLIGNGIKYRGDRRPLIHVSAVEAADEWLFSFRDNGIGIKPEYSERIFVIFQRLHHKSEYSGTGIGLAICKKVIERHGGRIWMESEPEEGSTFYFTLPARCPTEKNHEGAAGNELQTH